VPLGLTLGLKQTMVIYAIGLCPALLLLVPASFGRRLTITLLFGFGLTAGMLITGSYWMVHLWQDYANPFFPYFNRLFHSPWGLISDYRDPAFEPKTLAHWLFFPLFFGLDSRLAAEISFTDLRLPMLFLLIPLSPLLGVGRRRPLAVICLGLTITYVVWLRLFDIYRYLVAVEMLAPLLIAALLSARPIRRHRLAILAMVAILALSTHPGQWLRVPFDHRAVSAVLPEVENVDHALVVLAGHEPLSFLIPSFPETTRFLRIDSTFTNPDQTEVPFNALMKRQIDDHVGPILALFIDIERHDVVKRLGNDGLALIEESCQGVTSPIGAGDYRLCKVAKL
jgi:hypothetical protein